MEKSQVVIAGSVNKTLEPWKINGPTDGTEWGLRAERAGVDGPLAVDGRGVTKTQAKKKYVETRARFLDR